MTFKYDVESKVIKGSEVSCLDLRLRVPDTKENRKIMWNAIETMEDIKNE